MSVGCSWVAFTSAKWVSSFSALFWGYSVGNRVLTIMMLGLFRRRVFFRSLMYSILLHTFYSDIIYDFQFKLFFANLQHEILWLKNPHHESRWPSCKFPIAHSFNCLQMYKYKYFLIPSKTGTTKPAPHWEGQLSCTGSRSNEWEWVILAHALASYTHSPIPLAPHWDTTHNSGWEISV